MRNCKKEIFRKKYEEEEEMKFLGRNMRKKRRLSKADRSFIEYMLKHFKTSDGNIREPTESILLPTHSLDKLNKLKEKSTYCFKSDPGKAGWCGTCNVAIISTFIYRLTIIYLSPKPRKMRTVSVRPEVISDKKTQKK